MRMPSKSKCFILCWLLRKSQSQTFIGAHLCVEYENALKKQMFRSVLAS